MSIDDLIAESPGKEKPTILLAGLSANLVADLPGRTTFFYKSVLHQFTDNPKFADWEEHSWFDWSDQDLKDHKSGKLFREVLKLAEDESFIVIREPSMLAQSFVQVQLLTMGEKAINNELPFWPKRLRNALLKPHRRPL